MKLNASTTMIASFTSTARRFSGGLVLASAMVCLGTGASAQTTVLSSPVGVITEEVKKGLAGFAFPLIGADLFVGVASSNTSGAVAFSVADGDIGALLTAGGRYYLEVVTGPLEGERIDVVTAATIAAAGPTVVVELGNDTYSTLGTLPVDALVGARCVIRPHTTLAQLPAMFAPGLSGDRHRHKADAVSLLGTGGFETYHLGEDNASWFDEDERHRGEWGRKHRAWCGRHRHHRAPTDYRDMVIPPDVSVVISIRSRPHKVWTHEGLVRTSAFRKNLVRGMQAFASGFPVDLSPVQIGAFVDTSVPANTRWVGNNLFIFADQIEVLFSGRKPLDLYFLRADGHTWQALTRSWRENFANQPILGDTDMILIVRRNADAGFVIPRPFDL